MMKIKKIIFQPSQNEAINIALISHLSKDSDWEKNVKAVVYDKSEKIGNLLKVIRQLIKTKQKIDYVVLPELSVPREIIHYISEKLLRIGASLITGIEYRHITKKDSSGETANLVKNEMVYFLTVKNGSKIDHLAITQEKVSPAIHEEAELYNVGGKKMICENETKFLINHNNAFFSTLICNEFLDINLRSQLRGLIDLLFVLEWNKDTITYDALVNSAANDLHCYIAQINNREYGDTRLRAPFSKEYKRDVVKIKGGEYDYFVVGKVEFTNLRSFQSMHRGINEVFKPLPTGYVLVNERKI